MEIVTKRFLLRDFVESDRLAFLDYQADPRNLKFPESAASSPEHAARLFDLFQAWANDCPRLNYQLAIVQRQEPYILIGCCGLREIEGKTGEMELGIELDPTYWGRYGYAIEVGRALLDFGFNELKIEAISGSTVSANTRNTVRIRPLNPPILGDFYRSCSPRIGGWGADPNRIANTRIARLAEWSGAEVVVVRPGAGWSEVEWLLTKERWQHRVATLRI